VRSERISLDKVYRRYPFSIDEAHYESSRDRPEDGFLAWAVFEMAATRLASLGIGIFYLSDREFVIAPGEIIFSA
jgi:hypothetical protein